MLSGFIVMNKILTHFALFKGEKHAGSQRKRENMKETKI